MIDLKQGDCLELMKGIPDGSIDMILCDLPYGITACKWDKVIPFESLWEQYRRIAGGVIVLFGQEPFSTRLRTSAFDLYKYDWYWIKNTTSGFVHAKNRPLCNVELISVFSKKAVNHKTVSSNRMTYNPQGLIECNEEISNAKKKFNNTYGKRPSQKDSFIRQYTNYPKQTLIFDNIQPYKKVHPNEKPIDLLEYLIKTYTNEGETVLDNCMGSGSTGVACVNTNRSFIGFELDENYYKLACDRIIEANENKIKE